MKINFYGAAGEVTGSCSLIQSGGLNVLIDCGMFQGGFDSEKKNEDPFPFDVLSLTAVIITHAHLDHVGRLPLLIKAGYEGFFYSTLATKELTKLILDDSFGVMDYEHKHFGRKLLYSEEDIEAVISRIKPVEYYQPETIESPAEESVKKILKLKKNNSKIVFTLYDAGHIFGSAFVEIKAEGKKVVFSGDIGNVNVPILKETDPLPKGVDLLVCESTYGDRLHESTVERETLLRVAVEKTIQGGGVVMVPSFALERTQELLYGLNDLVERQGALRHVPIYLDSPLAIDALKVYRQHPEYYDGEAEKLKDGGDDIFDFPGLSLTYTRDESMKINHSTGPKIIIAGAGMMNGGRILHHALRYLSDHRNTLIIIGYQSPGTLGWRLLNGAPKVEVLGEQVNVHCNIRIINAFSAHGDKDKLMKWISSDKKHPKMVILNHGDQPSSNALADALTATGIKAEPAEREKVIEL